MNPRSWILSYLCSLLLLVFIPACSDDDGTPTDPGGGGGGGGIVNTGDPGVDQAIDRGLTAANEIMALAPQWASGNLVGPVTKDAEYSPSCQCWVWEVSEGDRNGNPWEYSTWTFQAKFYDAQETLIQDPQQAWRAEILAWYLWNKGFYEGEEFTKDDESTSFNASFELNVSPVGGDPVTVSGSGSAEYVSTGSINGQFWEQYGSFGMDLNLTLPLSGCPSGMIVFSSEPATLFSISYDGTSTAHWTFSAQELNNPITGSETIACPAD